MRKAILASASPRRVELMNYIPLEFTCEAADIDETFSNKLSVEDNVMHTAYLKAKAVYDKHGLSNADYVISADTVVSKDGLVLGKPKDEKDAFRMLELLSGSQHSVFSGVCIISKEKTLTFCDETIVDFRELSKKEIENYIKTKEPTDKAGAYAIQGYARIFVKEIIGNYENVMGLPISRLYDILKREFGLEG